MSDMEYRAQDFVTENGRFPFDDCLKIDASNLVEFAKNEKKILLDKVCTWLQEKLITDHVDTDHGLGCIMPDIIMCEEYWTVDDLVKALREHIEV